MKLVLVDLLLAVIRYCFLGIYRESETLVKVTLTNNLKEIYIPSQHLPAQTKKQTLEHGTNSLQS